MTRLMQKALEAVRGLPEERQDEIARAILNLANRETEPESISEADLTAVLEGLAQARRGKFASDGEVEQALRRFGA